MTELEVVRVGPDEAEVNVMLVHGAWHGAWCWQRGFAQRLADSGIGTVTLSLRGHGSSEGLGRLNRWRLNDYVDDVIEVLETIETPVIVVGHSMGGGVVQHLLVRTDRPPLAGAVLLASMPPAGVWRVTLNKLRNQTGTFLVANATWNLGRLVATPTMVQQMFLSSDAPVELVEQVSARMQSESYLAFVDMLVLNRPRPRRVTERILVLGGRDDTIFRVEDIEATAQAWGTEAVILDGIAHDLMLDVGWEEVADRVSAWCHETGRIGP